MRKNIFDLVNEKYDILSEAKKIDSLFHTEFYFLTNGYYTKEFTFEQTMNSLWQYWSRRGSTLNSQEFMQKADAWLSDENGIINFLEVIENYINFIIGYLNQTRDNPITVNTSFVSVFCRQVMMLEQRMGLVKKEFEDYVLLYPENAPLEKVLDIYGDDANAQWELIRYTREKLSLAEKKKSLAHFATIFSIEKNKNEDDKNLAYLVDKATNILNNLNIRHKNEGDNFVVDKITDKDQSELCDYAYSLIISIILLRDQKKYKLVYEDFHNKQKAVKSKNEGDKKDD